MFASHRYIRRYSASRVASLLCSIASTRASHIGSALAVPNYAQGVSFGAGRCLPALQQLSWRVQRVRMTHHEQPVYAVRW